jgi:hypothetical protein
MFDHQAGEFVAVDQHDAVRPVGRGRLARLLPPPVKPIGPPLEGGREDGTQAARDASGRIAAQRGCSMPLCSCSRSLRPLGRRLAARSRR